jgi:hypothetical protein
LLLDFSLSDIRSVINQYDSQNPKPMSTVTAIPLVDFNLAKYIDACGKIFGYNGALFLVRPMSLELFDVLFSLSLTDVKETEEVGSNIIDVNMDGFEDSLLDIILAIVIETLFIDISLEIT